MSTQDHVCNDLCQGDWHWFGLPPEQVEEALAQAPDIDCTTSSPEA